MTFEAMHHTGDLQADILVILNDNEISISKNVGALNSYLARIISNNQGTKLLDNSGSQSIVRNCLKKELAETEIYFKGIFFKELWFNYIGPIDGHNVLVLINVLKNIRNLKGPQLLHIITNKGKGYTPAEKDPIKWHAVPPFNLTGTLPNLYSTAIIVLFAIDRGGIVGEDGATHQGAFDIALHTWNDDYDS